MFRWLGELDAVDFVLLCILLAGATVAVFLLLEACSVMLG